MGHRGESGSMMSRLPEAEQKLIYATQGAPVADLFNQKVEGAAWKSKPSWYVLARETRRFTRICKALSQNA